jgi:CRISPR-associated protein Csx10
MGGLSLDLELLDEVALSRRPASEGAQPGLDYLPGANVLGAVAGALYATLGREEAWTVFHSGQVRFGNGLPLGPGGEPGWPMPLCWCREAEVSPLGEDGRLVSDRVYNLMHCRDGELPYCLEGSARAGLPMPEGYVAASGGYFKPRLTFRSKAAVSSEAGRGIGQSCFGYESLAEGQRFLADIAWDDTLPAHLETRVRAFFEARPVLSFGRSRSAQYGRVKCHMTPEPDPGPARHAMAGNELSLWLLSDLAACDPHGFSTLAPEPEALGLPSGVLLPRKTFVRRRAYSPYNGFHRLYGAERQVIAQGSVLTYRLDQPLDADACRLLEAQVARGLGLYRESGLGRCALAPALLATRHPQFGSALPEAPVAARGEALSNAPGHPLARWLVGAAEHRSRQGGMRQWAGEAVGELELLERNARRLSGLREDQSASPSRSHWGRVADAARRAGAAANGHRRLCEELFAEVGAVCRAHDEDWGRQTASAFGQPLTYRDWLRGKVAERPEDSPSAIALLAELAQRRLAGKP